MYFRVSPLALVLAAAVTSMSSEGCAHSDSVADRHISEMRETLTKIEAEQDRENQQIGNALVDADEKEKEKSANAPKAGAQKAAAVAPQRTVQIGDGDDGREGDDPNDPNARPEIRLQGQPGAGAAASRPLRSKSTARRNGGGDARIEPSGGGVDDARADGPDGRPSSSTRSSVLDPEAKKSYEAALAQINAKQYDRGLEGLNAFLVRYPDHPYVENAMYWRGEAYYAKGEYLRAAEQLEAVLARFSGGSKSADALFKIGMCHERLGSSDRAKEYWDRLKRDYPRSDAAKKIPNSNEKTNDTRGPVGPKESR